MPLRVWSPSYPEVMTAVYRFYDAAGGLLYVGVTNDLEARLKSHAKKRWWPEVVHTDVIWFDNRLDAMYEEARAIDFENPVHNNKRGLGPIGLIVIRRWFQSHWGWWTPIGELVVDKLSIDAVVREVGDRRSHAVLTVEANPAGIVVPLEWYRRACQLLDRPVDLAAMPAVHVEDF